MDIYKYNDYRDLIENIYMEQLGKKRGLFSKIAEVTQCQLAYVSQVFSQKTNFNLEQASLIAKDLGLDDEEKEYFFNLILIERSGHYELKSFYERKVQNKQKEKLNLSKRIKNSYFLKEEASRKYYSTWIYAAIHVIISIEKFNTLSQICEKLNLKESLVAKVLQDLEFWKLIEKTKERYSVTENSIHIKDNSPYITQHHTNWRLRSIQALQEINKVEDRLHFSSITAISEQTYFKLMKNFVEAIERNKKEIRTSKEEVLVGINVDLYQLF